MLLSDGAILLRMCSAGPDRIVVTPLIDSRQIQSASIDLRLGFHFKTIHSGYVSALDPLDPKFDAPETLDDSEAEELSRQELKRETERYTHDIKLPVKQPFYIHPGEFALGTTFEYIRLPGDVAASLEGRSSMGRLGITIHSTAGFIDPGFSGRITYEIENEGSAPVALYPGTRVAQLCFFELDRHAIEPYGNTGSKYKQQLTTTSSRWYEDRDIRYLRSLNRRARRRG